MIAHVLCTQEKTLANILLLEKVENKRPTLEQKETTDLFLCNLLKFYQIFFFPQQTKFNIHAYTFLDLTDLAFYQEHFLLLHCMCMLLVSTEWALVFFYFDAFPQRIISLSYIFYNYIFHATHCYLLLICFWLAFVIVLQRTKANCDQSNDLSSWRTLACVPPTSAVQWKFRTSLLSLVLSNLQQHTRCTPTREWVISSGGLQKLNPNETCLTDYKSSGGGSSWAEQLEVNPKVAGSNPNQKIHYLENEYNTLDHNKIIIK